MLLAFIFQQCGNMQGHCSIHLFGYRETEPLLGELQCDLHCMIHMNRNDFIQHRFTSRLFNLIAQCLYVGFYIGTHMVIDFCIIIPLCLIILKTAVHLLIDVQKFSIIALQLCLLIIHKYILIMHGQKIIHFLLFAGIQKSMVNMLLQQRQRNANYFILS